MSASTFTVWDAAECGLPLRGDRLGANYTTLPTETVLESLSVWRGAPIGQGPGLAVTSYDPQNLIKTNEGRWASMRGLLSLAVETINNFVDLIAEHEGVPIRDVARRHGVSLNTSQYTMYDAILRFSDVYVPAVRFDVGVPVDVLVSADLLSHPVALASWGGAELGRIPQLEPTNLTVPPPPKVPSRT